jgi:hypothetical protein
MEIRMEFEHSTAFEADSPAKNDPKSSAELLHDAKYGLIFNLDTRSTWKLGAIIH